ncbi:unnamed protein product [Pleuronectes platessa]|uniref:Uncharacterized protein n=1 Tax=Pleuronectes platessa TaxID=8262 RepID=A0A9N7TTR5_PLEPL|nr:unnamed protein product [Pleuronectes platessa]
MLIIQTCPVLLQRHTASFKGFFYELGLLVAEEPASSCLGKFEAGRGNKKRGRHVMVELLAEAVQSSSTPRTPVFTPKRFPASCIFRIPAQSGRHLLELQLGKPRRRGSHFSPAVLSGWKEAAGEKAQHITSSEPGSCCVRNNEPGPALPGQAGVEIEDLSGPEAAGVSSGDMETKI